MSKITVTGEAVVITSACKLEDLKTVQKYRPQALSLMGGEDGKEEVFRIIIDERGAGSIGTFGATFTGKTHDEHGYATITMMLDRITSASEDVKEKVAEAVGAAILNVNKIEEKLPAIIREINAEKAAILENIELA